MGREAQSPRPETHLMEEEGDRTEERGKPLRGESGQVGRAAVLTPGSFARTLVLGRPS